MAPPTFCGLSGDKLSFLVSTVSTLAFTLFGYDQGFVCSIAKALVSI